MAEDTLFSGESKNVEYKVDVPEKSEKYMKTVVAFANGRGGRIVFGIDDKTLDIVGMDVDNIYKTMDAITNAISDSCEPTIRPDVAMQTIKDKTMIVVEIFPGAERPYYIKSLGMIEGTYVRVSGTTRHVEDYMLKELILEGKNRYFDSEICQNMKISDSEIEELCKSLKDTAMRNTWQDSEKAKIKDVTKNVLISWGILTEEEGKVYPTNAYALLTGRMFQQPVIQCGVFTNTETNSETSTNTETNTKTNTEISDTGTETVERILRIMREQPSITVKSIAQQLALSVSGVRYHINKLKKDGTVEHTGSSKKGTWLIHK